MNRRDQDKASLVDFLRSIKFEHNQNNHKPEPSTHFAGFDPHAREGNQAKLEDRQLIRSAN